MNQQENIAQKSKFPIKYTTLKIIKLIDITKIKNQAYNLKEHKLLKILHQLHKQ
jgi:hypothetical protein